MIHRLEFVVLLIFATIDCSVSSYGDHHPLYKQCLNMCINKNCTSPLDLQEFETSRPWYMKVLQWDCESECSYDCMWVTVDYYHRIPMQCPQFHGKWPFQRVFGIQEIASVIFSICHALLHVHFWVKFRSKVSSESPMYIVWQVYSLISINTWVWSTIFHTRDLIWTERMDYFCATSLVLASLLAHCIRVLGWYGGILRAKVICLCIVIATLLFSTHVFYLSYVKFDYSYNMKANVSIGAINTIWIVSWSIKNRHKQPYVWKAIVTVMGTSLLLLLELWDFAPVAWIFDAHSIWHGTTLPLVLFWYSFIIDDCHYLHGFILKFKKSV